MKSALLTFIGLLELNKAAFPSLVDVLRENRYNKVFLPSNPCLAYIRLVEQDKPAFKETQDIKKNRFAKFFSTETNFFRAPSLVDVNKAAFPSLADVLGENR